MTPTCSLLTTLLAVFYFNAPTYAQCVIAPKTSISGNRCVGSELQIISNLLPESVIWERNGSIVSTQTVILQANAVTVAGGLGAGSAANQLNNPDRLYVDPAGVLYVPDLTNNRVQKWLPGATTGITVAGGNGAGAGANQFNRPSSVFLDQQGNLYVTDQANGRVQKWAPGATSGTTVAGGPGGDLNYPTDVFIDKNGNMYVSDQRQQVVRKYAPGATTGAVVAGDYTSTANATALYSPTGIFVDNAGNLYVCDTDNNRVQKWAAGATSGTTVVGGYPNLANPLDVSVDCNGNVYVADYGNNRIQKYPPGSSTGTTVAGNAGGGSGAAQLSNPIGVFIVGNNSLYVADYSNHRVQRFSTAIDTRFTPAQAGSYTVTVNYPCCPPYQESFEIQNEQKPQVSITATATDICFSNEVTFSAKNTNNILDPVYQWTLNGAAVGTNSAAYVSKTLRNKDKLQCVLTSTRACTLPLTATSNIVEMNVAEPVKPNLGADVSICPSSSTVLRVSPTYISYLWQDNSTQPELTVNKEGTYIVAVKDACNNVLADTIGLSFFKVATRFLPADLTICSYDTLTLTSNTTFKSYLWNNHSTASSLVITQRGLYWLQGTDDNRCVTSDSIFVQTTTCPPKGIYVPNAFSPNNDGSNETFKPLIYGSLKNYRFAVHNRYGQLIFSTTDPAQGWNGTVKGNYAGSGTYVWYCQYQQHGQPTTTAKGSFVLIK